MVALEPYSKDGEEEAHRQDACGGISGGKVSSGHGSRVVNSDAKGKQLPVLMSSGC